MDTFIVKLDGAEVARLTGEGLELGRRGEADDPKCIKKIVGEQTLFVLMASTRPNVTVERVDG